MSFLCGFFFLGIFFYLTRFSQSSLTTLFAAGFALRSGDHINDYASVVFAARRTCAMGPTKLAAIALHGSASDERMMAPALRGFRSIPTHSNNHG